MKARIGTITSLLLLVMLINTGEADAGEASETYNDITVTISAQDTAQPDTDFEVAVHGILSGYAYEYWVYEDAVWSYDSDHRVDVVSGTLLDTDWGFGNSYESSYWLSRPPGTYKYTFIFGAVFAHDNYQVAVDVEVAVEEESSGSCDVSWRPPLSDRGKAGRTIPLKFTAYDCDTGEFYVDEDVIVEAKDSYGNVIDNWSFTGNPTTGVDIAGEQYHVNWDSDGYMTGTYAITVLFNTGDILTREITLF